MRGFSPDHPGDAPRLTDCAVDMHSRRDVRLGASSRRLTIQDPPSGACSPAKAQPLWLRFEDTGTRARVLTHLRRQPPKWASGYTALVRQNSPLRLLPPGWVPYVVSAQ